MSDYALVTGSSGFVGTAMVHALKQQGYNVILADINQSHHLAYRRHSDMRRIMEWPLPRIGLAVHCAAHVGGRTDIDDRATYIDAYNSQLDGAFFEWVLRDEPEHIVYMSSSAAYPIDLQDAASVKAFPRLSEKVIDIYDPAPADMTYGAVKLHGERLAMEVGKECDSKILIVRPFSGYGEMQSLQYPFPAFVQRAKNRDDPFVIWGDGSQQRDWIHINDMVNAILTLVRAGMKEAVVNICSGVGVTMWELAERIAWRAGYKPQFIEDFTKPMGVFHRVGDPSLMNTFYTPRVTLDDGILRMLAGSRDGYELG